MRMGMLQMQCLERRRRRRGFPFTLVRKYHIGVCKCRGPRRWNCRSTGRRRRAPGALAVESGSYGGHDQTKKKEDQVAPLRFRALDNLNQGEYFLCPVFRLKKISKNVLSFKDTSWAPEKLARADQGVANINGKSYRTSEGSNNIRIAIAIMSKQHLHFQFSEKNHSAVKIK